MKKKTLALIALSAAAVIWYKSSKNSEYEERLENINKHWRGTLGYRKDIDNLKWAEKNLAAAKESGDKKAVQKAEQDLLMVRANTNGAKRDYEKQQEAEKARKVMNSALAQLGFVKLNKDGSVDLVEAAKKIGEANSQLRQEIAKSTATEQAELRRQKQEEIQRNTQLLVGARTAQQNYEEARKKFASHMTTTAKSVRVEFLQKEDKERAERVARARQRIKNGHGFKPSRRRMKQQPISQRLGDTLKASR